MSEIVALTDKVGYLRCEVGVVLFSVALWYVFLVCLLNDSVKLGNSVVNVCDWEEVQMFKLCFCIVFEFLPVCSFEVVVCFAWLSVVGFGLGFNDDG